MVIAVSRPLTRLFTLGWLSLGASVIVMSTNVHAQSSGAFATRPYVLPGSTSSPPQIQVTPMSTRGQGEAVAPPYRGPAPVTMFRATSAPPSIHPDMPKNVSVRAPSSPERPPYSIIAQSQRDAQTVFEDAPQVPSPTMSRQSQPAWNPASLEEVVAPPMVASGLEIPRYGVTGQQGVNPRLPGASGQRFHRRALRRIFEDSRTGLTYDLPEGIADALPWVDRDRKNERFEDVLERVADDLSRAAQSDPEWALGAQREIRELSKKLDTFPAPPPRSGDVFDPAPSEPRNEQAVLNGRPFRPRPIWPGASGRPEAQVRPSTIVTMSGTQAGPQAAGVTAAYVPTSEDATSETPPRNRAPTRRTRSTRR